MRNTLLLVAFAGTLASTGCSSLLSLNPVADESVTYFEPGLVGVWAAADDDKDPFIIRDNKDRSYSIHFENEDFEARLFAAGAARFLDVCPKEDHALQVPGHAVVRIRLEGDTLSWAFVDSAWIRSQIAEQRLAAQDTGKMLVVTAPGAAFRNLLAVQGQDEKAWGDVQTLRRVR